MSRLLPVLMYHGLHAGPDDAGRFDPVYSVTPDDFRKQLDWLVNNTYRAVRLRDLDALDASIKPIIITFDDGDVSNYTIALPLLKERGFAAEFFVTADFIDQHGMLTAANTRALADAGMGVQSHGCTHRYLEDLDDAALASELRDSKHRLERIGGGDVDALALPGGRGGERERRAARELGYRHVLNSAPGVNRGWRDGDYLERAAVTRGMGLDEFIALVTWRGVGPRWQRMRFRLLRLPKRMLGNKRYERWRSRVLRT
ncbi:MAG TPA: polysaccharide deacetylase family protein [Rudaea sp.]|jgi:peptidoglycan/xylan/chitin deacetylase (PgdA/CDA1 family)|nr:polysaccharide deacetylase family protein [Rudaea sp.]